jgi:hypothetical protein
VPPFSATKASPIPQILTAFVTICFGLPLKPFRLSPSPFRPDITSQASRRCKRSAAIHLAVQNPFQKTFALYVGLSHNARDDKINLLLKKSFLSFDLLV